MLLTCSREIPTSPRSLGSACERRVRIRTSSSVWWAFSIPSTLLGFGSKPWLWGFSAHWDSQPDNFFHQGCEDGRLYRRWGQRGTPLFSVLSGSHRDMGGQEPVGLSIDTTASWYEDEPNPPSETHNIKVIKHNISPFFTCCIRKKKPVTTIIVLHRYTIRMQCSKWYWKRFMCWTWNIQKHNFYFIARFIRWKTYLFPQGNIIGYIVESPVDESDVVEVVVGDVWHNFQERPGGQSCKIITGFMFVFPKEHYQRGTHSTTS